MQKHMIHKQHDNEHYCACIYMYLQFMAVELCDISSFYMYILMGVLVATNESYQSYLTIH